MSYKAETRRRLLEIYDTYGLTSSLTLAKQVLESSCKVKDITFRQELHGELCETVLEILLIDYKKQHPVRTKDWIIGKSTILKDRDNINSSFCTEIDIILYTPECIYLFECKSYSGDKVLLGKGELLRKGKSGFNVYEQSKLHLDVLSKWLEGGTLYNKKPVFKMCFMNFSKGTLTDKRSISSRQDLVLVNKDNLASLLDKSAEDVWDMQFLNKVKCKFDNMSEKLRLAHLEYVKSLHRKEV